MKCLPWTELNVAVGLSTLLVQYRYIRDGQNNAAETITVTCLAMPMLLQFAWATAAARASLPDLFGLKQRSNGRRSFTHVGVFHFIQYDNTILSNTVQLAAHSSNNAGEGGVPSARGAKEAAAALLRAKRFLPLRTVSALYSSSAPSIVA